MSTVSIQAQLAENLAAVRDRIDRSAQRVGRSADEVKLVVVTKKTPAEWSKQLVEIGQLDLGENYPQELWAKGESLLDRSIRWHHIGHLQANKVRRTLQIARWIHGVDSLRLLDRIDQIAGELSLPTRPQILLQVNLSGEASKHGWTIAGITEQIDQIRPPAHLDLRGLMTIAGYGTDNATARPVFVQLRELRERLEDRCQRPLPDLSMGMSGDFEAAVEEGATLVRVGSAIFKGLDP